VTAPTPAKGGPISRRHNPGKARVVKTVGGTTTVATATSVQATRRYRLDSTARFVKAVES